MASFLSLPNEVIELIGRISLTGQQFNLALTNRHLHHLINPIIYKENVKFSFGSAMFWAARFDRLDTLELLRTYGADLNDSNASRSDFVYDIAYPRWKDIDGGDIDSWDTFFSPLHIAARFGRYSAVKWLL